MSPDDLTKKAAQLRDDGRLNEAELLLRAGLKDHPKSANIWWHLYFVYDEKKEPAKVREALQKTVELAPTFSPALRNLGRIIKNEDVDAAVLLFERAAESSDELGALRELIRIYYDRKQYADVVRVGQLYEPRERLTSEHSLLVGNACLSEGQLDLAEREYLRLISEGHPDPSRFNVGLVYNNPQSGRHLDALDAWRMALHENPDYDRAKKNIESTLAATLDLFDRSVTKLPSWAPAPYEFYLNPLALLALPADSIDAALEPKALQKPKARLLREIELEDGKVEWMPGLVLDRSRAVGLLEQMNDSNVASYHRHVHRIPALEAFLQTGSLALFKPDAESFPLETLIKLEADSTGFGRWLSSFFARQMGQMQMRAI